jgi:hypothetical protein
MRPLPLLVLCLALVAPARADVVADWLDALVDADARAPGAFSRNAALMHVAIFDAVNAIEGRYASYGPVPGFERPASSLAAACAAAHAVLVRAFPSFKTDFDGRLQRCLDRIGEASERRNGAALGRAVAEAHLAAREGDGFTPDSSSRPRTTPGVYVSTTLPVGEALALTRPFALSHAAQFRPPPPPALASETYARDFHEVMEHGARRSTVRSAASGALSRFIALSHTKLQLQPTAAALRERPLPLVDAARVMALHAIASFDALIASFEAKYHYGFWRPITAIRNGDLDGNAATERDETWVPLVETPAHPEYPCNHCVQAAVTATVFASAFPGAQPPVLRIANAAYPGKLLEYTDPAGWPRDAIEGRISGGIHFRSSSEAGVALGGRVARHVIDTVLRPR